MEAFQHLHTVTRTQNTMMVNASFEFLPEFQKVSFFKKKEKKTCLKNCRRSATDPATAGVAMLVPVLHSTISLVPEDAE